MPSRQKPLLTKGVLLGRRGSLDTMAIINGLLIINGISRSHRREKPNRKSICTTTCWANDIYSNPVEFQAIDDVLPDELFYMMLPGEVVANYELHVLNFILRNVGCTANDILVGVQGSRDLATVRSAVTRLSNKGLTFIHNFFNPIRLEDTHGQRSFY